MNILYRGNYHRRFESVKKLISGKTVTELCFGDIIIANFCKENYIHWTGIDVNKTFVKNAKKKGFNALQCDLTELENFPKADTCIMSGSLYHFNNDLESMFAKMLTCSNKIILSEPVVNLSSNKGIIGSLARASANVKGSKQSFRFTKDTLIEALNSYSKKMKFDFKIIEQFNKDLIVLITNDKSK